MGRFKLAGVNDGHTGLWKLNITTGLWNLERSCPDHSAKLWLAEYEKDEPNGIFKLSKNKPSYRDAKIAIDQFYNKVAS